MDIKKGDVILTNGVDINLNTIEIQYTVLKVISESMYLCKAITQDIYEHVDGCKDRIIHHNQIIKVIKDNDDEK